MIKNNKDYFNLAEAIKNYFRIEKFTPIIEWLEDNIDLSKDVSSQNSKLDFKKYPYQVDILKQCQEDNGQKIITVVAPEQMR